MENVDRHTVSGFGFEWQQFDQSKLSEQESEELFEGYFRIFPWDKLPAGAVGMDVGCGSGRWARRVASRVGRLHCIDASAEAVSVARRNLGGLENCDFHCARVDRMPVSDASLDFGYSLGVLHHVPDTTAAIRSCVQKLKRGAPFLVYLYYALENQPAWFRMLWRATDVLRRCISSCPPAIRLAASQIIAGLVYYPLARISLLAEAAGLDVGRIPLSFYRKKTFYTMRTDALDRFGTALEQRFTAGQTKAMMIAAGLTNIRVSDQKPFWCAVGYRET